MKIKSSILVIILGLALVLTPVVVMAQTTDSHNTTTTTTDNSDHSDNSDNSDHSNKEKVVVVCKVKNTIKDSANNKGDQESDVENDADQEVDDQDNEAEAEGDGDVTTGDNTSTQTITQETTVDQLSSIVADFEQRGCDITVNYKTTTNNGQDGRDGRDGRDGEDGTNTVTDRVVERDVVRTVSVPSSPPATGGN